VARHGIEFRSRRFADWCKARGIKPAVFDSIINKTPLSFRTNRIIGGVAPSEYLDKLQKGTTTAPAIEGPSLDGFLRSHLIDPGLLRPDSFDAFLVDRQKRLLALIESATGKAAYQGEAVEEGQDVEPDEDSLDAAIEGSKVAGKARTLSATEWTSKSLISKTISVSSAPICPKVHPPRIGRFGGVAGAMRGGVLMQFGLASQASLA
jgi:hypothetical protein